ncbi:MAG: galactokinase [Dehalococcoidales bacterium]|nr:MAG: galactokinase [Dehalococcoidales bacterium]
MTELAIRVTSSFQQTWSKVPDAAGTAPGRINLIGEHTDYTGGFVLPVAIDRHIVFAAVRTGHSEIVGHSIDFDEEARCQTGRYDPEHPVTWFRYIMGVLSEIESTGHPVPGFCFSVGGDIPIGAGLASSAALEMATLTAIEGLLGFKIGDKEAALLCQRVENDFMGVSCGIMDQFISRMGRCDQALLINCTDLSSELVAANLPGYSWLVVDSGMRRGLVDSEYNRRRQECEEALRLACTLFPDRVIKNLRDVSVTDLPELKQICSDTVYKRLRHVVTENARVLTVVAALRKGDTDRVGQLLHESHQSLRDDFEVSCEEIDSLVEALSGMAGVTGARLTGAGFGGSIIALANTDAISGIEKDIERQSHATGAVKEAELRVFPVQIVDGARLLEVNG